MQATTDGSRDPSRTIGELCVGGDWACADGDLETLGYIARRLAAYTPDPLHCELVKLAELCRYDPDRAVAAWVELKEQVLGHAGPPR